MLKLEVLNNLVMLVQSIRPAWDTRGIRAVLERLDRDSWNLQDITTCAIKAAQDQSIATPGGIPYMPKEAPKAKDQPGAKQDQRRQEDLEWQRENRREWAACNLCDEWGYVCDKDGIKRRCSHDAVPVDVQLDRTKARAAMARSRIRPTKFQKALAGITKRVDGPESRLPYLPPDLEAQVKQRQEEDAQREQEEPQSS